MNLLAQTPPPDASLPAWVWVVISITGAGGFWGWMKVLTNKRYGLVGELLAQLGVLQQQVGSLATKVETLQVGEKKLKLQYQYLARISLDEINRLRKALKIDQLTQWPPPRPVRPPSPVQA